MSRTAGVERAVIRGRVVRVVSAAVVIVVVVVTMLALVTAFSVRARARHPAAVLDQGLAMPHRGVPVGRLDTHDRVATTIAAGRLLFVGASYSVGWGATDADDRYEYLVARRLDRRFAINAVAGTGFLNPGAAHEGTFAQRVARIPVALDPRIVVLQGGRDDRRYAPAAEYRAAVATIELVQRRFVHAQVVVLGPIPSTVPVPVRERAINDALARACVTARAGYIDAIAQGWITRRDESGYLGVVPGHPDDRGYSFIADRLIADLPAALADAGPPVDPSDNPKNTQSGSP